MRKFYEAAVRYVFDDNGHLFSNNNDEAGNAVGAFEAGCKEGVKRAVDVLIAQHMNCQPGTLVSYYIAAEVLAVELLLDQPPDTRSFEQLQFEARRLVDKLSSPTLGFTETDYAALVAIVMGRREE